MADLFVLLLYIVFGLILGALAVALKKHTQFPDFRVGYHTKKAMENKEKWDHVNNTAGNLCGMFAAISGILSVILYLLNANARTAVILFFIYSITAVLVVLLLPIRISKK